MGEQLLRGNRGNPKGHFENVEFVNLNEQILAKASGSWKNPPSPKRLRTLNFPENDIQRFLAKHAKEVWGIKDPRMMITIDYWKEHLQRHSDISYVFVHRPFRESVLSLARRDHLTRAQARSILKPYLENKQRIKQLLLKEQADVIDIHFHDLLHAPEHFVSELNKRLGHAPTQHLEEVKKFLDKSFKNF
ncbi:sulfotransferase family protein [Halalkalibacter urbisdiaboli]|uniref:sulfotransferase family protein n=1 Tax=Halalkalibacter urbisdiaboli TaxID=1960589 RepID=UPI000B452885|nr:sulfotransferase family protein [Halalkalibacter urbisdiaboli]